MILISLSGLAQVGPREDLNGTVTVGKQPSTEVSAIGLLQYFSQGLFYDEKIRDYVPLTDGKKVQFDKIASMVFLAADAKVYESSLHEVDVQIVLKSGRQLSCRLNREGALTLSLVGKWEGGDFKVDLDESAGTRVEVVFAK